MSALAALALRLKTRFCVELDLYRWRRETASLKRYKLPCAERRALFCSLFSSVAGAKAEALFAHFLARRGYAVTLVLRGCNRPVERIFRSVLDVRVVYLDTYTDRLERPETEREVAAIFHRAATIQELLDVTVDNVRVGRNVLSWVARKLRVGSIDPANSGHRTLIEATLGESVRTLRGGQAMLAETRPDLALFLERGYTPAGEIFDLCIAAGVDTIQWLGAPQSGTFLFKRYDAANRAYHPLALDAASWREIKAMDWTRELDDLLMARLASHYQTGAWFNRQKLQENKKLKSRAGIVSQLGLDPSKKIAVIFSHILYDATFFYGESLFADYAEWLTETVREAIANPRLNWLVKVHPVNVWRSETDGVPMEQLEAALLRDVFGELPDHVKILPADTDINTYSLFEAIDYGLTVRGTVGMELPCYGIPTVTAGSGRYSGNGFTIDPKTPEEYRAVLAGLHDLGRLTPAETELGRRYAFGTFFLRPIAIDFFDFDFHANDFGLNLFAHNVRVPNAGGEAKDMNAIADWMAGEKTMDFLARDDALGGLAPDGGDSRRHQNTSRNPLGESVA